MFHTPDAPLFKNFGMISYCKLQPKQSHPDAENWRTFYVLLNLLLCCVYVCELLYCLCIAVLHNVVAGLLYISCRIGHFSCRIALF